jgi:hypothetical protein
MSTLDSGTVDPTAFIIRRAVRTASLAVSTYAIRVGHAESCIYELKHFSQAFLRREEK